MALADGARLGAGHCPPGSQCDTHREENQDNCNQRDIREHLTTPGGKPLNDASL